MISFFNEQGLLTVKIGKKYGVINTMGQEVCKVEYDSVVIDQKNEIILVIKDNKWGIFDNK
jgi:hypothetical protein